MPFALDGRGPNLHKAAFIAQTAVIIGDVTLGEDASVWFGAVLRGDNAAIIIGPRSNVQDLSVIHVDPGFEVEVGADVTIGHRAIVHGCTIGDGTLIGMGAIVMTGARVGRHCLVGAGTIITEGQEIPDASLVIGAPGKVVRTLDATAIEGLAGLAESYVANAQRYAAGFAPVS